MVEFYTTDGIAIDLEPNQDLAVTIENPLLASDRIPIAWSTDIEIAVSRSNCRLFGFPNAMLLSPARKEINVKMLIDGISVMTGKLRLLGPSSKVLKASFTGVKIEDSLNGSLTDAPFDRWNFGTLDGVDKTRFDEMLSEAANNARDDFAIPLMMRESEKDTPDNYVVNSNGLETFAAKYLNYRDANFLVPVVKLHYILHKIFADCSIDEKYRPYFDAIGIVAPYRKNGTISDPKPGCLDKDENQNYILDLAGAMPNVTLEGFLKNLLTTFCATIYITSNGKWMIANDTIIRNRDFVDWNGKIADNAEQLFEEGQNYEYEFSGITDSEIKEQISECTSIADCLKAAEGSIVHCAHTGDIYKKIKQTYVAGANSVTYERDGLEIMRQEGLIQRDPPKSSLETYSASSDWIPVKSLPYCFDYSEGMLQFVEGVMLPIIDLPSVGGTRPNAIQFGILGTPYTPDYVPKYANSVQLTSNGCFGLELGFYSEPKAPSLNLTGPDGLYEKFHKAFKEWLSKDKTTTKASLNLSAAEIANLQLWKKVMFFNQYFFIKTLTINLNTSHNKIDTDGEFIPA